MIKVQLSEAKQQANVVQFQLQEKEKELSTAQLQLSEAMEELNGLRRELEEKENIEREKEKQRKEEDFFWFVRKEDIVMIEKVLGRGGWGEVRVALFQGLKVAAKVLHETIISEYNLSIFSREMEIAAKVRHRFGHHVSNPDYCLNCPEGIDFDCNGLLYICDYFNKRIVVY
ncbi:PREDICTED: uncharacterized protein LOC109585536 [Amphimedon queenslandica]|uniref:Protein kinase domain-containing protein n=1 Tax=Amphimedon queenslandica TaxID=400682 RepID=A0A1X7TXI3_AMPQE|nr:PREDICTED: uncharacterized protein LOC109585536 [Amphimedon queenslandica]|eukprot:XP_019857221.1 PREDICTED: uncharacterized protein LOC109585536 [Amphimedon queenslandica]